MKYFYVLNMILFTLSNLYSQESSNLKCSANGTDIYYINGVLVSSDGNKKDRTEIEKIFDRPGILDSKGVVNVIGIHNPSYGILNDTAELFEQAYYIKTGGTQGKAYYNLVNTIPDATITALSVIDPTKITSTLGLFGFSKTINFSTLKFIAEESYAVSLKRSLASDDELIKGNQSVIESVKEKFVGANSTDGIKKKNKKAIFVAHSQGNAVLLAGVKKLLSDHPDYRDYVKKFTGYMQVASPVPEINKIMDFIDGNLNLSFHARSIRFGGDSIIDLAGSIPGYPLIPAPITHTPLVNESSDPTGHFFSDTYLSEKVMLRKYVQGGEVILNSKDLFLEDVAGIAEDLEDNCDLPNIKITSDEAALNIFGKLEVSGYARSDRTIKIRIEDIAGDKDNDNKDENGYDRKKTKFTYKLTVSYPSDVDRPANITVGELFVNNEGYAELELAIPYRDFGYKLVVTAINQFEKESTKSMEFIVPANQKLQAQLSSKACYVDQYGYNPDGKIFWEVSVNDDEYLFDNKKYKKSSDLRSIEDSYYDSEHVAKLTIVNDCEISKWPLTYEVWATCQNTHCSVLLGLGCGDYYVNTGFQWNELRIYDMFGNWVNRKELAGGAYGHSVVGGFVDPNDGVTLVSFPTAEACPTAQESKEPQTFKIQ